VEYTISVVGDCGKIWGKLKKLGTTNMFEGFKGEYTHLMDGKRRISIPAKMRKSLGKKGVITRGVDECLVLYPLAEWKTMAEKLQQLPTAKKESRALVRLLLAGATEVSLDKLGRILIPEYLAKYAHLQKNAIVVGLSNRIEIWDKEKWDAYRKKAETNLPSLIEQLGDLGI